MASHKKGVLLVLAGAILWGSSGVAAQYLIQGCGLTPEWLVTLRMLLAGIILLTIDALGHGGDIFTIWHSRANALGILLFAAFGMLGVQYTYLAAIEFGNAATATVLAYLMPAIIVGWTAISLRRMPSHRELLCVALALLGTFLLATHGDPGSLAISRKTLFWGIASAFAGAFYTIQPRRMIRAWRSTLVVGWGMLAGGLGFSVFSHPWQVPGLWDWRALLVFAHIILCGTVIAFWAYLGSLNYIRPEETGMLASVEPLSAITFSTLLLGVDFGPIDMLGTLLILGIVFLLGHKAAPGSRHGQAKGGAAPC